ncbi:MAG: glycosyltransferase [Thermomicrobiales bacterium]
MAHIEEIHIAPESLDRFTALVGSEQIEEISRIATATARRMAGRVWWNVSSTARGGGVAEMLQVLLAYARGAGIDTRWLVIQGTPEFFHITKRLHHAIHGSHGDGSPLGDTERSIYEKVLEENANELIGFVQAGDVVLLHDPQTAGLASELSHAGALVIWRSHIGVEVANDETASAWAFLQPYLTHVRAAVFSRGTYIPANLELEHSVVIPPSIDPFSPKNQDLDEATIRAILVHTGLVEGPGGDGLPIFRHTDGSPGRVSRRADVIRHGPAISWDAPLVVQVSRWDPLKDPIGVLLGFAESEDLPPEARLILAGPNVAGVSDDPEGAACFDDVLEAWRQLSSADRGRIHLVSLPMTDIEENAAIVNALQRHAAIVVQKSLHEGFGLTVTEAMWKSRPVVASRVGGIQDQIEDGIHGLLINDPTDLTAFGSALSRLFGDHEVAEYLGTNAHERVRHDFLGPRHLARYAELLERIEQQPC